MACCQLVSVQLRRLAAANVVVTANRPAGGWERALPAPTHNSASIAAFASFPTTMRTPPLIRLMISATFTSFHVGKLLAALITPPSTAPGQPNPIPAMPVHDTPASRSAASQHSATHAKTACSKYGVTTVARHMAGVAGQANLDTTRIAKAFTSSGRVGLCRQSSCAGRLSPVQCNALAAEQDAVIADHSGFGVRCT